MQKDIIVVLLPLNFMQRASHLSICTMYTWRMIAYRRSSASSPSGISDEHTEVSICYAVKIQ